MIYGSAASAAAQAGNNYAAQSSDGLVEHLADRIGASGILEAFNRSTGGKVVNWILDKTGEGMEETITGFGEPLIDRITYDPKADLATADELADEFLGGVILSLLLSGGERLSSWQKSGNGISEREVIDRLEEMGIPSEVAREYAAQTAQAASVLINAGKPVPPVPQRAAERPTEAPLTHPEDRGTMKPKAYEFGNNDFYGIETPQVVRTYTRRSTELIRGGQPFVSSDGNDLVSVNPDGSIRDFASLSAKLATVAKRGENGKLRDVGPGTQKGDNYGRGTEERTVRKRSPVFGRVEESQGSGQEIASRRIGPKEAKSTGALGQGDPRRADRVKSAASVPENGTLERWYLDKAKNEYGVNTYIVPSNVWETEFGKNAPAFRSRKGEVYAREGVTMEDADIGFPHEITHIMKQAGFEPYLRLLEEVPDYVDFSNPQMRDILDAALKHISATFEELSDKYTVNRLYDELLSTVYGLAINGKTSGNTNFAGYVDFRNIFNDFDELFQRLKETHESFKVRNGIPGIPSAGITSVLGPENMQLPAKQTPWQEYLEWYTRQIGELTRRQLSPPEEGETVWQRYLHQHEQDLWEHNRQRVKANTEIGYQGGEQYGFGTEEGRTIREEPQVSGGLEESAGTLRAASTGGAGALSQRSGRIRKRSDSQWQDRLKSAAITPKKGSLEQVFTERAMAQYGLKANTLPTNAFNAEFRRVNPDIKEEEIPCMFCAGGEIYIREGITEAELAIGLPHEANHAMGELGYEPYLAILKEAPDYLNIDYPGTLTVLDALLKHVNRQFEDLGDDEAINRLFDEALSVVYGKAVTGTLKGYGKLSNVDYGKLFNDFNELFQRLEEAHKGFEIWNKNRQIGKASTEISDEDGGSVNSGDMETAQRIPAEQTPWREYLEWYARQIGELTRLRLSPPEERETVWQRYLRQYEKEREIEKALKTVEILGTVPEEYAALLEEAPGTDALVALRHWEDRRRWDK